MLPPNVRAETSIFRLCHGLIKWAMRKHSNSHERMSRHVSEYAMIHRTDQIDKNANGVSADLLVRNAWGGESSIHILTLTA
jgi:hypothetical protein